MQYWVWEDRTNEKTVDHGPFKTEAEAKGAMAELVRSIKATFSPTALDERSVDEFEALWKDENGAFQGRKVGICRVLLK